MPEDAQPRIMSWKTRIALAIGLGALTALAVAWFASIFPVEQWLSIAAPVNGFVLLDHSPGSVWCGSVNGESSPLSSHVMVQFIKYDGYDEQRKVLLFQGGTLLLPVMSWKECGGGLCAEDLDSIPRRASEVVDIYSFGWPLHAMQYRKEGVLAPGTFTPPNSSGAFLSPFSMPGMRSPATLPLNPRWGAIVIDTAAYSAAWLMLLLLPRMARAVEWRVKRKCAACGYDLRGTERGARCPECGREP